MRAQQQVQLAELRRQLLEARRHLGATGVAHPRVDPVQGFERRLASLVQPQQGLERQFRQRGIDLRHVALGVTVVAGLLMVSRIRYTSFKGGSSGPKADRVPFFALLIVVVVLIALAIDAPKTLLAATLLYALSGPLLWFRRRKLPVQDAAG